MQEWQQRVRERAAETVLRRAARAASRRAMAERRRRGMDLRIARKLIRADLDNTDPHDRQ
jgi:hypothetical protein